MKLFYTFLFCCLFNQISYAQYNGNIWCFGDSAGVNFNATPPSTFTSGVLTRNGCATIADTNGLLFYCSDYDYYIVNQGINKAGIVKNKNHVTMQNGEQLVGTWYHDMIIIPKSSIDSTFYIITGGVTNNSGLWYNIIDLKLQNGMGEVIQKNIQLQTFNTFDGFTAVKHGNGKDWWLLVEPYDRSLQTVNNDFYVYRVDSSGISAPIFQQVGTLNNNGGGDVTFNKDGSKFVFCRWGGLIELYDFDRCSGTISNPVLIEPDRPINPYPIYTSAIFSPSGRFIYIASYDEANSNHLFNYLYQYDLLNPNAASSRIIIDSFPDKTGILSMEMAADKKIYMSALDEHFSYPYPDTAHTNITDYLSVINQPDSFGLACDFQPFSFYLGGRRTYYGLPNNPDYTLGPLAGSVCDTLTAVHELKNENTNELKIFYQPQWDIAFINADKLKGKNYTLTLYDISGKMIVKEYGNLLPPYFTKDLSMQNFAKGIYVAMLQTEKEVLKKKFVKY